MQPLYSGPAERYMVAPRVAVVFKRRDQVGGFISMWSQRTRQPPASLSPATPAGRGQ
jgi:hypothetical protein